MDTIARTSDILWIGGLTLAALVLIVALVLTYRHLTKKVGPNEALIIFGGHGTRIVVGGSAFVNPITEQCRVFSLELMSFPVAPDHPLYTSQGIAVMVEAVAQLKVRADDPASIRTASEQFLSKTQQEREQLVRQVMEGHLRHIVGHLMVEDLVKNTDHVAQQMSSSASSEFERMGLIIVSFTLRHIHDHNDYIASLGKLQVEEMRRQVAITSAQTQRDIEAAQAKAAREAAYVKARAEEERARVEINVRAQQAKLQHAQAIKAAQLEQEVIAERLKTQEAKRQYHLLLAWTRLEAQQGTLQGGEGDVRQPLTQQLATLMQQLHEGGLPSSALSCVTRHLDGPKETQNGIVAQTHTVQPERAATQTVV